MTPVIQEETTGCGIASVAAVAGVSYAKAKRIANAIGIFADDPKLWSETEYIRQLSVRFNIQISKTQKLFRSWNTLPDCALLAIKWHLEKGQPFWHWTVFVRDGEESYVLDSKKALKTHKRTDFGRIKPKWYLEVFLDPWNGK